LRTNSLNSVQWQGTFLLFSVYKIP